MENEFNCPLINLCIDETICYDIQMVANNMIDKRILKDYDFAVNEGLITNERVKNFCDKCSFNQLMGMLAIKEKMAV